MTAAGKEGSRAWTGRTLLYVLLAFFGVMVGANAVFVYFAVESWSGLSTEDAYRKGISYNETISRAQSQHALGWQTSLSLEKRAGARARLVLSALDSRGQAIESDAVTAVFRGPVSEGYDFEVVLAPAGQGTFAAEFDVPSPGQWDVRVEIARRDGLSYLIESRLWPK